MHTLQCIANSLQDVSTLQRLRDNLEALPRKLLARHDPQEDYLFGTVTGEFNYHFTFRLEGGIFSQSGVLVASAERVAGGLPVPLKCRWKRRVGDLSVEIPSVTSNMYQISADDVGTDILVEAQPADADDGLWGNAHGEIGPFELDPITRRTLDNALGLGEARFTVAQSKDLLLQNPMPSLTENLTITVTEDRVRVASVPNSGTRDEVAEFSQDFPRVIIHPLDTGKFSLVMCEATTFHVVAQSRDLVAMTIRCFHARKHISTAAILKQLLPFSAANTGTGPAAATGKDSQLDTLIVLERLIKELNRVTQQKEVSDKVLRNTRNERGNLQDQLLETISGYTEVIVGLQDQLADPSAFPASPPQSPERVRQQISEAKTVNRQLQSELQRVKQEYLQLQASKEVRGGDEQREAEELRRLKEKRSILQSQLVEFKSGSTTESQRNQSDLNHTQELKRLRREVEVLHNSKEQLRRDLQEKNDELDQLQKGMLTLKEQLDRVQMRNARDPDTDGSELQRHQKTLGQAGEERSRLSSRLEQILNEFEKEKAYHEQSLDRLTKVNAKLMEEKDRSSREVQRLSQLYADSVEQLQGQCCDTERGAAGYGVDGADDAHAAADPQEMRQIKDELAATEEALKKCELENESFKSRIRRLAVA